MSQQSHFSIDYSEHSDDTAEYEDQLADLTDLNVTSFMTDMTEVTPLPDDIDVAQISQYFDSMSKSHRSNTIHTNAPHPIKYLIGESHESLSNSIFDDLTYDNMNPFIVLLGVEGIGKSTITTFVCNDLLHETEQLFKDGILYLDLMKYYTQYQHKSFEECLIAGIKESGLHSHWIDKFDDFLEINVSNVFNKVDQHLSNSLIVFEDFDRFMDINNLSLEDCNQFLFNLFENISLQTKIIITSRKKLPIYYNFNAFRTKFYEICAFTKDDTLNYFLSYCDSLHRDDIIPYLDEIADLTSSKPLYLHSLHKLWQNIRMFESTFDSIITLYQEMDHEQHLRSANPFNESHIQNETEIESKKQIRLTVSQSSSSSTPSSGSPHELKEDVNEMNGLQPLFAYTNLYCAPNSPSAHAAEFHSPLSTYNGHYGHNVMSNNDGDHLQSLELPIMINHKSPKKKHGKQKRPRSQSHQKRNKSVGFNIFDPKRRKSDKIQQFYKINTIHKHRYSIDAEEIQHLMLSREADDKNDDHYRVAPLSPLSPWNRLNPAMFNVNAVVSDDDTVFKYNENANRNGIQSEKEKKKKKKHNHNHLLNANNIKTHLNLQIHNENDDANDDNDGTETYDSFLAALGAEIHKQQTKERDEDEKSMLSTKSTQSMQNYNIRINDVDVNRIRSVSLRNPSTTLPPSGYLTAFDLPPTPPLSSVVGIMSDDSGECNHMNEIEMDDTISVNSDTMRQNKLISITLIANEKDKQGLIPIAKEEKEEGGLKLKVGDVYFNKFLRMTLILNIGISSWSRSWLINGVARSLRTADIRFSVHKDEGIADGCSYVSLLCRCDEYDIKQLKYTFEFSFISHELEQCIAESLGQPTLKIICASCVSYRHFKYLYPKQFLNWITRSLPNAKTINDHDSHIKRKKYKAPLNKTSIMNAQYIKLPFAMQKVLNNKDKQHTNKTIATPPPLTPPNMTILHFMQCMS